MSDKTKLIKEGAEFIQAQDLTLKYHPEWVLDPPPWIIQYLDKDNLMKIYRIKLEGLAKIKEIESRVIRDIHETI